MTDAIAAGQESADEAAQRAAEEARRREIFLECLPTQLIRAYQMRRVSWEKEMVDFLMWKRWQVHRLLCWIRILQNWEEELIH